MRRAAATEIGIGNMEKRSVLSQMFASVLVNSIYAMINYPIMLLNTLLSPLSILVIIIFVSHGSLVSVGIEGALIMTMVSSGISLQGDLSHLKNDFKLQDMVVSSPTSQAVYLAGMAVSELIFSLPIIILLAILAAVFVHPTMVQAAVIAIVMVIMFVFSISLGFVLSTFTSDIVQSWGFSGIVSVLLSTLPPVYYPISYIPVPFRYIAYLSPTTYGAELVQATIGFVHLSKINIIVDWIVITAIAAALIVIAYKKARWREP